MTEETKRTAGRGRRRVGCVAFIALWVCIAAISVFSGLLAVRGDLVFNQDSLRETRIWLIQEQGNRGLGLSTMRFASGDVGSQEACVETNARFLLWQRQEPSQAVTYCECFQRTGDMWEYLGTCSE